MNMETFELNHIEIIILFVFIFVLGLAINKYLREKRVEKE